MSLFDSFHALDRSWDDRVLEHHSVRSVFVWLLVSLFVLGADAGIASYQAIRLHRFDWPNFAVFAVIGIICFRYARIIYRRFGV